MAARLVQFEPWLPRICHCSQPIVRTNNKKALTPGQCSNQMHSGSVILGGNVSNI